MSRLRNRLTVVGILGGAAVLATLMVVLRPAPPVREPPSRVPFVTTAEANEVSGAIPVNSAGTVRPRAEIDVIAQVSGQVASVAPTFQSGGKVSEGQTLFRIDDADYLNRVQQARANVAAQQVALLQAEEEARIARAEYEGFVRRRAGDPPGEASPLTLKQPQLEAARAALARDSATLADAELALSRTEVRAPFSGVVRTDMVDPGQFVAAGQGVGRLYADDAVEVVVPLSDADAALIPDLWTLEAGDGDRSVQARVFSEYGGASYSWSGYLDRAEAAVDVQTRTIDVVVRIPDPFAGGRATADEYGSEVDDGRRGPPLLVGQFVEVLIDGTAPGRYFTVPRAALRTGNEVWALRPDSSVTIVPVNILQRTDRLVYVTGALEDGQAVVLSGIQFATEGMVVRSNLDGPG